MLEASREPRRAQSRPWVTAFRGTPIRALSLAMSLAAGAGCGDDGRSGRELPSRRVDDGAATGSDSVVAREPLLLTVQRDSDAWLGDYEGIVLTASRAYSAFADNGDGTSHVRFPRVSVQP